MSGWLTVEVEGFSEAECKDKARVIAQEFWGQDDVMLVLAEAHSRSAESADGSLASFLFTAVYETAPQLPGQQPVGRRPQPPPRKP